MLTYYDLQNSRPRRSRTTYGWRIHRSIYAMPLEGVAGFKLREKLRRRDDTGQPMFVDLAICSPNGWQALTDKAFRITELQRAIGFEATKIPGRAEEGLVFHWYDSALRKQVTRKGNFPITILPDQIIVSPVKVRQIDEAKRKAFNAKLKEVRNFFRVRAKLGVFNNFTLGECKDAWFLSRQSFVKTLLAVDVSDLNTFKPILGRMFYWAWRSPEVIADMDIDLLVRFNQVIDSEREQCKIELDVVTYVVP